MSRSFNIVLARPRSEQEYYHTQCFHEVADLLRFGLRDLGFEVKFTGNLVEGHLNIVLGYHALAGRQLSGSFDCIIYQLEELADDLNGIGKMLNTLKSPCLVWDFSQENIDYLKRHGIEAIYKPMGFHPKMQRIKHCEQKDIDILFYGSLNDRRRKILNELSQNFHVKILFGSYGPDRDKWIARSKIVLSVYFFKTRYFVRLSYLLNNKVFTIVEDTPYRKYEDLIVYAPYCKIVETCRYFLENEHLIEEQVEKAAQGFAKFPETAFLRKALLMDKVT